MICVILRDVLIASYNLFDVFKLLFINYPLPNARKHTQDTVYTSVIISYFMKIKGVDFCLR